MSDYSILDAALSMGGVIRRQINFSTGEIVELGELDRPEGGTREGGCLRERSSLSKPHNSTWHSLTDTLPGTITFWTGGSKIHISKHKYVLQGKHKCGIRGNIGDFSQASRRRLIGRMCEISRENLPHFLTLTYGAKYPESSKVWKSHLKRFGQRLKRKFPKMGAIWKLEPQKRGAPHFHLLVWGLGGWEMEILQIVAEIWHNIAGYGDIKHLQFHLGLLRDSKPCLSRCKNWKQVMGYVSKYLAKTIEKNEDWENPGRFWGVLHKDCIPWAEMVKHSIEGKNIPAFLRYMRRYAGIKYRDYPSLTGFVVNPDRWLDLLRSAEFQ